MTSKLPLLLFPRPVEKEPEDDRFRRKSRMGNGLLPLVDGVRRPMAKVRWRK
jgi:hypothetical protein